MLVYRIGHLGDTIIALPAMWAVRKHFPDVRLSLLSNGSDDSHHVLAPTVLPVDDLFEQCLTYPVLPDGKKVAVIASLFFMLRREKFDGLVYLAPRDRTPFRVRRDLLFFRSAGIRNHFGHRGFEPHPPGASVRPLPEMQHEADHLLHRLSLDGIPVPPLGHGAMDLKLTETERSDANAWLTGHCPEPFPGRRLVGIGPSSKWPSKVWPADKFSDLCGRLVRELGLFPVVFGGREDADIGRTVLAACGTGANAAGALTVRQAAAALERCDFYVGNDTGTMHLAAAVGTRCVAVFSAQEHPGRWYPYGKGHVVLRKAVSCEGCRRTVCTEDTGCLKEIAVVEVMEACRQMAKRCE